MAQKSTKITGYWWQSSETLQYLKHPREWCQYQFKESLLSSMLCLCFVLVPQWQDRDQKSMEKGKGTERKSFTTRQGCQSPPDWTENNKVQQEEWNQSFPRAELPQSLPAVTHERQQLFPPGYFFKNPLRQNLSIQFHQEPNTWRGWTPWGGSSSASLHLVILPIDKKKK